MAFTRNVKTILPDLSNYAEIRRGLSKAMRDITPTKTMLKQVDAATREKFINDLNNWRNADQSTKIQGAKQPLALQNVFTTEAKNNFYSKAEKVQLFRANLKLRTMGKDRAGRETREAFNAYGRLRTRDYYAAKYYLDSGQWDPEKATFAMLDAIVNDPEFYHYDENTIDRTLRAYYADMYAAELSGLSDTEQSEMLDKYVQSEGGQLKAAVLRDYLAISKLITG